MRRFRYPSIHLISLRKVRLGCIRAIHNNNTVMKSMNVDKLHSLIKSNDIQEYQLIDVREPSEIPLANLNINNVYYLPLSTSATWSQMIMEGKQHPLQHPQQQRHQQQLYPDKPTLCLCHHGGRSRRMAMKLINNFDFTNVYSIEGGINAYATNMDPAVGIY